MVDPVAAVSNVASNMLSTGTDVSTSFKTKAAFMKAWKPASQPSNRDKLELYALHKQALSGDAPPHLTTSTANERAKYNAWKSKSGLSAQEAMRLYVQECERQVRVYGSASSNAAAAENPNEADHVASSAVSSVASTSTTTTSPRGLAAIPLLCAAASESRVSYLRRLSNTQPHQAWWSRQEALCAPHTHSILALPETLLIKLAGFLELVALSWNGPLLPAPVLQSFLWPLHNTFLSLWMGLILVSTSWMACLQLAQTIVWGSRRTGLQLSGIWDNVLVLLQTKRSVLVEQHQPLTARLVGLVLAPLHLIVSVAHKLPLLWGSLLYIGAMCVTWWYWLLVLPWMGAIMLGAALVAGNCYALIEMAGV
ncbi:hypothetical protein MPSEU_001104200 [Mayamaea pseudoterrestris]|nr:hypothetical protein MPSEU_001104200 [Mayamaea pseudoterrestris]